MPRRAVGVAKRGSQKWLQYVVNQRPELLNSAVAETVPDCRPDEITWLSPVEDDQYSEYQDRAFLRRLGIELPNIDLSEFWPRGGPVWDGLANTSNGDILLVEAKAHIPELNSSPSVASISSAKIITRSLSTVKDYLGSGAPANWSSCFYQYTNRLAHLYLLRSLNDLDAWLLNVYFVGDDDIGGPETKEEWLGAIRLMKSHLGLGRHALRRYVKNLFIDVRRLDARK